MTLPSRRQMRAGSPGLRRAFSTSPPGIPYYPRISKRATIAANLMIVEIKRCFF
jgi:hypothetical protein